MSGLFDKMLDMLMNKKNSSSGSGGSLRNPGNLPKIDLNKGNLGGILGGVMGKGGFSLSSLVRRMMKAGLTSIISSWIGKGKNQLISPDQIRSLIGTQELDRLANENGISTDQLTHVLAEYLPDAVDQMTPDGELKDDLGNVINLDGPQITPTGITVQSSTPQE